MSFRLCPAKTHRGEWTGVSMEKVDLFGQDLGQTGSVLI